MEETNRKPARMLESPPKSYKKLIIGIFLVILIIVSSLFVYFMQAKDSNPFPKNIRTSINFPLYYPLPLPNEYSLSKTSLKNSNGIIFYSLNNGKKTILISEQTVPSKPPDLAHIEDFKHIAVSAGDAATGLNGGQPTALLLTDTTLITITGLGGVSENNISDTLQNMKLISTN
jgi:hypothetical protein